MKDNILICGANWLGDCVMSMPAVQMLKRRRPGARITMLLKRSMAPLWKMHGDVDETVAVRENPLGTLLTAGAIRAMGFDMALIFPNSFRSALIPFLAGVPVRKGVAGHERGWMLTEVSVLQDRPGREHQAWEYIELTGVPCGDDTFEAPHIAVPAEAVAEVRLRFGIAAGQNWVGLIPGAAHGPSKRWPAEHFAEVGKAVNDLYACRVMVFGARNESDVCAAVADRIGPDALNLAGKTSIPDLAALLTLCRVAVTNDSGGMHLATAVGTRVVAIFGMTDPAKTGPLGAGHRIILDEGTARSRDIDRDSEEARVALRSITPDRILVATADLLAVNHQPLTGPNHVSSQRP